jgi:hypothetical protein
MPEADAADANSEAEANSEAKTNSEAEADACRRRS